MKSLKKVFPQSIFHEAPRCLDEQILRFHSPEYLMKMNALFDAAESTKIVQVIDSDTNVMWATREAAYRAVGSVIAAVDDIFTVKEDGSKLR